MQVKWYTYKSNDRNVEKVKGDTGIVRFGNKSYMFAFFSICNYSPMGF